MKFLAKSKFYYHLISVINHSHIFFSVTILKRTGHKVGFKPAGGIRSAKDALVWLALMKEELGEEWTQPHLFRIGASSLLVDIERQLFHHVYGR